MSVEITRPGKNSLVIETPVMPASGVFGFGDVYRDLIEVDRLGAIVTNPVTFLPWNPATGTRVIPLDAGVLLHTGLPNPGLNKVIDQYRTTWKMLPVPIIVHVVATTLDHLRRGAALLDREETIAAIELGLHDDIGWKEAESFVKAVTSLTEKPVLVRLPLQDSVAALDQIARASADAGAGALVAGAPPRGTTRDAVTGRLIGGRVYGPLVRPLALRLVGQLTGRVTIPVIGAGGIHSAQDARDFLEAGAVAVQVDSAVWVEPKLLEIIARDLGGLVVTREMGAMADEWFPGMGETTRRERLEGLSLLDADEPPEKP